MHERVVAIAADYADALLVVRRAKRLLLLLLLLTLLGQIAIFACVHFGVIKPPADVAAAVNPVASRATTLPLADGTVAAIGRPIDPAAASATSKWNLLTYATIATLTGGVVLGALLSLTLFLTVHIMLVGRLIGVAYVTRAFVLSLFLTLLLFPWQTLLATATIGGRDSVLPGVLYTWGEITSRVPFTGGDTFQTILYWARFAGWPLVALIILLLVQVRSGKGLKLALGEEEVLAIDVGGPDGHTVVR